MADKAADDSGGQKFLNRMVAGGAPYLERFIRTKVAPYVIHSKPFDIIMKMGDPETMAGVGKALPGFWSMMINEIPSEAFLSREIGDTVKNITTIFFTELSHALEGNLNPTPEQYHAAEEKAIKAVEDYLEQDVYYDRDGYWHFAACHKWQGNRNPAKAKLRQALELGREAGYGCCQRKAVEIKAKVAEPAQAAEAPKASAIPGKIPAGASVVDILALMPEEARKKLRTWLQSLSEEKFSEVEALMTQHLDSVFEGIELSEIEDANKLRFLGLMKNRTAQRKSKIAEMRTELEQHALKAYLFTMQRLKDLDESVVSTAFLTQVRQGTADLRAGKPSAKKTKLSLKDIFGL